MDNHYIFENNAGLICVTPHDILYLFLYDSNLRPLKSMRLQKCFIELNKEKIYYEMLKLISFSIPQEETITHLLKSPNKLKLKKFIYPNHTISKIKSFKNDDKTFLNHMPNSIFSHDGFAEIDRKYIYLFRWPLISLKQYGSDEGLFGFECGRQGSTGPGNFKFMSKKSAEIFEEIRQNLQNIVNETRLLQEKCQLNQIISYNTRKLALPPEPKNRNIKNLKLPLFNNASRDNSSKEPKNIMGLSKISDDPVSDPSKDYYYSNVETGEIQPSTPIHVLNHVDKSFISPARTLKRIWTHYSHRYHHHRLKSKSDLNSHTVSSRSDRKRQFCQHNRSKNRRMCITFRHTDINSGGSNSLSSESTLTYNAVRNSQSHIVDEYDKVNYDPKEIYSIYDVKANDSNHLNKGEHVFENVDLPISIPSKIKTDANKYQTSNLINHTNSMGNSENWRRKPISLNLASNFELHHIENKLGSLDINNKHKESSAKSNANVSKVKSQPHDYYQLFHSQIKDTGQSLYISKSLSDNVYINVGDVHNENDEIYNDCPELYPKSSGLLSTLNYIEVDSSIPIQEQYMQSSSNHDLNNPCDIKNDNKTLPFNMSDKSFTTTDFESFTPSPKIYADSPGSESNAKNFTIGTKKGSTFHFSPASNRCDSLSSTSFSFDSKTRSTIEKQQSLQKIRSSFKFAHILNRLGLGNEAKISDLGDTKSIENQIDKDEQERATKPLEDYSELYGNPDPNYARLNLKSMWVMSHLKED
ncbi:unnamed protein product [Gordionus sp. m RMFG-2023]